MASPTEAATERQRPARQAGRGEPRRATLLGWVAAAGVLVALAVVVGGPGVDAGDVPPSGSPEQEVAAITFGTGRDPSTGQLVGTGGTFQAGGSFVYRLELDEPIGAATVWVEVTRTEPAPGVVVQDPSPLAADPASPRVEFEVPIDSLLGAWGPGTYEMRIYAERQGALIGQGRFSLAAPEASSGS